LPFNKRQTLPNFRRLKSGEEFRLALAAHFYSNKWFAIYARRNKIGTSRLGIIVSKKAAPHAVNRNYAKRLIREKFRRDFPIWYAVDIVVRLRRSMDQGTSGGVPEALVQLLGDIQRDASVFN
jgi:ribonuclease P protein component